jgi:hypothetical protein
MIVFWDVKPRRFIKHYPRFAKSAVPVGWVWSLKKNSSLTAQTIEAAATGTSETSVTLHKLIACHIPNDFIFNIILISSSRFIQGYLTT